MGLENDLGQMDVSLRFSLVCEAVGLRYSALAARLV